jgi:hypothetical protein
MILVAYLAAVAAILAPISVVVAASLHRKQLNRIEINVNGRLESALAEIAVLRDSLTQQATARLDDAKTQISELRDEARQPPSA